MWILFHKFAAFSFKETLSHLVQSPMQLLFLTAKILMEVNPVPLYYVNQSRVLWLEWDSRQIARLWIETLLTVHGKPKATSHNSFQEKLRILYFVVYQTLGYSLHIRVIGIFGDMKQDIADVTGLREEWVYVLYSAFLPADNSHFRVDHGHLRDFAVLKFRN
jgi:hypothetical protein